MSTILIIWCIICAACLIIDFATSAFAFVWFSIGAVGAIVAYFLEASITVQIMVFSIISIVLFAIAYPFIRKCLKKERPKVKSMGSEFVGRIFEVSEDFNDKNLLKFDGIYWTFTSEDKIDKGDKVKIISIDGNKLVVKKMNSIY